MAAGDYKSDGWIRGISRSVTVIPSSSPFSDGLARGLLVDAAGNVTVTYEDGTSDTLTLAAGVWHPMLITHITAATATGLHIGY